MHYRNSLSIALTWVIAMGVSDAYAAAPLAVAALEDAQCIEPTQTGVRPLFVKSAQGWAAIDAKGSGELSDAQWSIALDGKLLGKLRSSPAVGDSPLLPAATGQALPPIGNAQQRFEGWCGTPKRRPLAASNRGAFADPDQWKRFGPDKDMLDSLLAPFRTQVGTSVSVCKGDALSDWRFEIKDLKLAGGYQDRQGRKLVGIALDPATNTCDGPAEPGWQSHWFVITDKVSFLGTNLDLVEAVDFDGDGASELLLWRSDYNQDGYVLVPGSLQGSVEKLWSYH